MSYALLGLLTLLLVPASSFSYESHKETVDRVLGNIAKVAGKSMKVLFRDDGSTSLAERHPTNLSSNKQAVSFQDWMKLVDWKGIPNHHASHSTQSEKKVIQALESDLVPFLSMEPPAAVNAAANPPDLVRIPEGCQQHANIFSGARDAPAAVIDVFNFGYEADALEVRLHEYAGIADLFVILEPEVSYWGVPRKVMWDYLRVQPRFQKFQKRVLHLVFGPEDFLNFKRREEFGWDKGFRFEKRSLDLTKKCLPEVLHTLGFAEDAAVVNYGDADELTHRNNMHLMKHCQPKHLPVDSAIWYPRGGRVDLAYKSNWPVAGNQKKSELPFSYGDPTFQSPRNFSGHGRGRSGPYLLGGMHMSDSSYLPAWIIKMISTSDSPGISPLLLPLLSGGLADSFFEELHNLTVLRTQAKYRNISLLTVDELLKVDPLYKDEVYVPWFLASNKARYPTWFGKQDPRIHIPVQIGARPEEVSAIRLGEHDAKVQPDGHIQGLQVQVSKEPRKDQEVLEHRQNMMRRAEVGNS